MNNCKNPWCELPLTKKDIDIHNEVDGHESEIECQKCRDGYESEKSVYERSSILFNFDEVFSDIFGGA